jgi:hypothetical protein
LVKLKKKDPPKEEYNREYYKVIESEPEEKK